MKRIIYALFSALCLVGTMPAQAQTAYNAIATAYVTTSISQSVVFDSTMQQGGTFNFSVTSAGVSYSLGF
jgi:hypothetical protein